jgi:serine/threonine protein kinase
MLAVKTPDTEPIPGYRLLEPLGRGGYGEVWKCMAPGDLAKAIKFVPAGDSIVDSGGAAEQELRALRHIKEIRHPFLLSIERVEVLDGEVAIVMELADRNLYDLLRECNRQGLAGIPRHDLLAYFRDAAEALDLLNLEYGLQHLDVKPRNLFVVGRHVKVADFGLVNSLAEMHGGSADAAQLGVATPIYSAPETFMGRITLFSDQYSLAVTYCELLTGVLPFSGRNYRQLALQHTSSPPELGALPDHDQPIVARALAKEPGERFASCLEFVGALEDAAPRPAAQGSRAVRIAKAPPAPAVVPADTNTIPVVAPAGKGAPVSVSTAGDLSLANFQFVECLARMPMGESWRACDGAGRHYRIKLVFGCPAATEAGDGEAVRNLQLLRHDRLEPLVVVRDGPNRIALIHGEHDGTLADRLLECRAGGKPGLPQDEILKYLWHIAEALDDLYADHELQHLTLNPSSLILDERRLRICDFGLAQLIWLPAGFEPAKLNPRYAPPELLEGRIVPASDQYSLALMYHELLTGEPSFRNLSPRQLTSPGLRGQPAFDRLAGLERAVALRAVHPNPDQRFKTCCDFVIALKEATAPPPAPRRSSAAVRILSPGIVEATAPLPAELPARDRKKVLKTLLAEAMGPTTVRELKGFRFRVAPGLSMEHSFTARFLPGTLAIKLEGFRRHWIGKEIGSGPNEKVMHITPPAAGLKRWLGKVPGLRLQVTHGTWRDVDLPVPIAVRLEPLPGGEHLLEELGPRIFDSIRQYLQAEPDRRQEERFRLDKLVRVAPMFDKDDVGEGIVAQALDVTHDGFGLFLPCRPKSDHLLLDLSGGKGSPLLVPATIVRAEPRPDGRYLVGVKFDEVAEK